MVKIKRISIYNLMKPTITMDAESSKFHHGSVAVLDDNDAGNDKIINDKIQDLTKEII